MYDVAQLQYGEASILGESESELASGEQLVSWDIDRRIGLPGLKVSEGMRRMSEAAVSFRWCR